MNTDWTEERIRKIERESGSPAEIVEALISLWKKGLVYPALRGATIVWAATMKDSN
jgi:hypothetical protein